MTAAYDTLSQCMAERYSCRAFLPDPVPEDVLEKIVAQAGRAPSWCNAQPWRVTLTRGAETDQFRAALLETVAKTQPKPDLPWPSGYSGAHQERRRTCGFQLYDAAGIAREDKAGRQRQTMRNFELFDAPHVAIISSGSELGAYGALDCGGFVTAFMLAATSLGVATIAQASVAAYPEFIRTHFNLPDDRLILCAISLGYENPEAPVNGFRTERANLTEIYDPRG